MGEPDQANSASSEKGNPASLKILLVDDTPMNLSLAQKLLTRKGHTVVTTDDGKKAVEAFQKESFDVVLMDVRMPVMDGLEATRQIRKLEIDALEQTPSKKSVSIIAMTANDLESDRQQCFDAGMDGFITKPLNIKQVVPTIHKIIEEKKSNA